MLDILSFPAWGPNGILLGLLGILLSAWYLYKPPNLPPGPRGVPVLGYMPFLVRDPLRTLSELGRKYGPVFSVYLGSRLVVVLHDYEAVKKVFVRSTAFFKDRPIDSAFNVKGTESSILKYEDWRPQRRFALSTLRDFGVGKLSLEPKLSDEIRYFTEDLEKTGGKAGDFRDKIGISVANNICNLTFGKRFDYEDAKFLKLKHYLDELILQFNSLAPWIFFPWLRYVPGVSRLLKTDNTMTIFKAVDDFVRDIVADHRKDLNHDRKDDYIHAYLSEQGRRSDRSFPDSALQDTGRAFFGAGTETSATWLAWTILYLAKNPDMQRKMQEEIDRVIGKDRCPIYAERQRTPYTCAFIAEIGRYVTVVPITPPHTQEPVAEIEGYRVPPNTYIIYNIWNIHHDTKLWGDPEVFRPERFLAESGEMQAPEYYMPFGVGKRACLGESLARMEIYLYVATLAQKFTFAPPQGETVSTEGKLGLTYAPKTFRICAVPRFRE